MGMIRRYHRCAQGSCPSAIYFCLFHHGAHCEHLIHVKQLSDGEGGVKREKKSVRREKMSGGRQGGWRRAVEWKDCFSLISIYSENVDRAHMLFLSGVLFCIHVCTHLHLGPAQIFFYCLATEKLTRAIGG